MKGMRAVEVADIVEDIGKEGCEVGKVCKLLVGWKSGEDSGVWKEVTRGRGLSR